LSFVFVFFLLVQRKAFIRYSFSKAPPSGSLPP
jgi:hypothetical protein